MTAPLTLKLSPSEFAFLYRECDRCAVLKVRDGIARPYMPFPSVFQAIDKSLRGIFAGADVSRIDPALPPGTLATKGHKVKFSRDIETGGRTVRIEVSGITDATVAHEDGGISVLDFKVSGRDVSGEADRYACQLAAYALGERARLNAPHTPIHALGLIVMSPGGVQPGMGDSYPLMMHMQYVPIPVERALATLDSELARIAALATAEYDDPAGLPPSAPKCAVCAAQAKRAAHETPAV